MQFLNFLFHGTIVGIILFQTSVIAPTVFSTVNSKDTSKFLRKIFPKFFLFIISLGLMSLLHGLIYENTIIEKFISIVTVFMALICYLIIPATNSATDEGDKKKFKLLHAISVFSTIGILLLNIFIFLI